MLEVVAGLALALAAVGVGQSAAGWLLLRRRLAQPLAAPAHLPPITLLKPLHGAEPLLEAALASNCALAYPAFQIVFGLGSPEDPALAVVERLRTRFPACDIAVVCDATRHGPNGKIGNLINMLPAAKHDMLVIADSDVHVAPDYLHRITAALEQPGVGLATTLYTGLPVPGLAARLGAMAINHAFLPGAAIARAMGRQDCLGATMALSRSVLDRIGGFESLVDHLADDNLLGVRVRTLGLGVALAQTIPATTVGEAGLAALWRHELRWGRTIRALVPVQFGLSALQHSVAWALIAVALSGAALWAVFGALCLWAAKILISGAMDRSLGLSGPRAAASLLWPVRDLLSFVTVIASYTGNTVEWRGQTLRAAALPPRSSASLGTELS